MERYSRPGLSYSNLTPQLKEFARIIYIEKERDPSKTYVSIIQQHPEFTFKSKQRASDLYKMYKNHLMRINRSP